MHDLSRVLTDADLHYMIRLAAPQTTDRERMLRVLRQDADILAGMLRDPRLVEHLMAEPERVVTASPRLFFAVLLVRVRGDLERTTFTVEQEDRHSMLVFDSREVAGFMHRADILAYLVAMLSSFLKIRTQTLLVRLRRGMWGRIIYSDMDLDSLLAWGERAGPEERFPLERRIGDLCLFQSGFFPSARSLTRQEAPEPSRPREALAALGRSYYRKASRHREARELEVAGTLDELAERFDMAVKPLALMASRYLDSFRERIFAV